MSSRQNSKAKRLIFVGRMIVSEVVKEGIITEINGHRATVEVACNSDACPGCRISLFCKNDHNTVRLKTTVSSGAKVYCGDRVIVIGRIKGWFISWFLLAGLPIIAILGSVIAGFAMGLKDGIVGILAIVMTTIYYIGLWFFRKNLNRRVEWVIESNEDPPN